MSAIKPRVSFCVVPMSVPTYLWHVKFEKHVSFEPDPKISLHLDTVTLQIQVPRSR